LSTPFTCLSHTRRCCWSVYVVCSIHVSVTHTTLLLVCLRCPLHSPVYHTHTTLLLVCLRCPLHSPVYHTHNAAAGLSTLSAPFTCLSHAQRCCWSVYVVLSIHLSITHTTLLLVCLRCLHSIHLSVTRTTLLLLVCLRCLLHSPVYHTDAAAGLSTFSASFTCLSHTHDAAAGLSTLSTPFTCLSHTRRCCRSVYIVHFIHLSITHTHDAAAAGLSTLSTAFTCLSHAHTTLLPVCLHCPLHSPVYHTHTTLLLVCLHCPLHSPVCHTHDAAAAGLSTLSTPFTCLSHTHTTLLLVCLRCPLHSPFYHTHTRRCCWSVYVVLSIHLSVGSFLEYCVS